MKQFYLLCLLICLLFTNNLKAAETEPNNDKTTANVLALNGSNTGAINAAEDEDWFSVNADEDGKLDVTIAVSNSLILYCYLYDTDGTTLLASGYSSGTTTVSKDGLATGKYYIKLVAFYSTQLPAYTVSNLLTKPAELNDDEPNNSKAQAKVLPLNDNKTGHAGYYYNLQRDTADWYKITTNADGLLRLTLTSANGQSMYVSLYDNNGTTLLQTKYSSSNTVLSEDGLAAGSYYVKINCFYTSDFAPYTIADSLFEPGQVNDVEPNNSPAQAMILPLNDSGTGHAGYYYNLKRDTADWYKITTNADGLLRLTLTTANSQSMYVSLYDNDGTTLLETKYSSSNAVISEDGLAAGTYYVKINCFYTSGFAPYTIADSLFEPKQSNDVESNNSPAQATILPLNDSGTGHTGYYYNLQRDTTDWYKITTNADGLLRLILTSANSQSMYVSLYDHDGTTLLDTKYSSSNAIISEDGLAAGTYYVKINCFYTSGFAPYAIADSLFAYSYTNDEEYNGKPYLGKTIPANRNTDGHVGFYYNNMRDTVDWYKINYTGSGDLDFTINQETLKAGGYNTYYFQVYKDTTASPAYSSYSSAASRTINLTGLTQGYYWIKVYAFYNSEFLSYSFSNSFKQVNVAKIVFQDSAAHNTCNNDSIIYKLSNSHSPYTVKLYRNNKLYDSVTTTSANIKFGGLNAGSYYATAYGDGATDEAFGKSTTTQFLPPYPTGLFTTDTTTEAAVLNWNTLSCASSYMVQYRLSGSTKWITATTNNPKLAVTNLLSDTTYYWQVKSVNDTEGFNLMSEYSSLDSFKTLAILPVTFLNFDGILRNNNAYLSWSTADEINNKGFEVQKSLDGQNFSGSGFVNGHNNSATINNYSYTDVKVVSGSNYYRLKQIDNDGKFMFSSVIKIDYSKFDWAILGNPVANNSWIQLQLDNAAAISVQIVSMNGNVIQNISKGNLSAGTYSIPLNFTNKSSGMYIVRLMVGEHVYNKKIIK